jgi:hypothetical protein
MRKGVRNKNGQKKRGTINTFKPLAEVVKKGSAAKEQRRQKMKKRIHLLQKKRGKHTSLDKVRQIARYSKRRTDHENLTLCRKRPLSRRTATV